MKKLEKYNTASEFNKEHLKTAKVEFQFEPRNVFKLSIFPGGPGGGVFPQHAAEAAAEHNPEDEVVEEVEGGGELGHLVVDAREDPSTSQSSGRGYSQVVSVPEFHVNAYVPVSQPEYFLAETSHPERLMIPI